MTSKRDLADTIARAIADQIESSRSIIVQNMADVIHDALLLDAARRGGAEQIEGASEYLALRRNFENEFQGTVRAITGINKIGGMACSDPNKIPESAKLPWGSLKNWWQAETE